MKGRSIVLTAIFFSIFIFTGSHSTAAEKGDKIGNFDIRGIKLGMKPDEAKKVLPITFHEVTNYKEKNIANRFTGGAGTGWGTITDWTSCIAVAGEPYGDGVCYFLYKKIFNEHIDAPTFVVTFRDDLISKYGKPTCEKTDKVTKDFHKYSACWGDSCNNDILKFSGRFDEDPDFVRRVLKSGEIKNGKYLIVTYDSVVRMVLLDANPYAIQLKKEQEGEVNRAKKKVGF
jgi:hypothetical protein